MGLSAGNASRGWAILIGNLGPDTPTWNCVLWGCEALGCHWEGVKPWDVPWEELWRLGVSLGVCGASG